MPAVSARLNGDGVVNFGQDSTFAGNKTKQNNTDGNSIGDFYYTPPSGFLALCNENLPNNTFDLNTGEKPSEHFNIVTYTGNDSTNSITGVGFQPDFLWQKERGGVASHSLSDVLRGAGKHLPSDAGVAELTSASGTDVVSFDSDGFTLGSSNYDRVNVNGDTYVAWCWKANGAGVSNTNGTITSTVSANTTAGFSIISYTGTGSAATVGHGLSSAPEMMIFKVRNSTNSWTTYHKEIGATKYLELDTSGGAGTASSTFNNTAPTSSVFSVNTANSTNASGNNFICYAWHSVPGFSKVGSYDGNSSTDGTFVYTGFRPAFVLIKYTGSGEGWNMQDTARYPENGPNANVLRADLSNAEANSSASKIDFVSNGFKHRATDWSLNASGYTYIYIAFAEDPFKYGNSR